MHSVVAKKWSATKVQDRRARSSRLRAHRKSTSPARALIGELSVVREVVMADYLREEPDLVARRWVTYSYMSALQCTELFCQLYLAAYRNHHARVRDHSTAADQMPVSTELFQNDDRQINGLWRARQEADRLGMPYEIFLDTVVGWGAEQKNRKHFPAPNQLYGPKQLDAARSKWEQAQDVIDLFAPHWDARLFVGDERAGLPRIKALRLARARVNNARHPEVALANLLERGAIDETLARRIFHTRAGVVDEAIKRLGAVPQTPMRRELPQAIPGCLGITHDCAAKACAQCPLAAACGRVWREASELLLRTFGDADPRAARRREQAALRQQKHRKRKRDAAVASPARSGPADFHS